MIDFGVMSIFKPCVHNTCLTIVTRLVISQHVNFRILTLERLTFLEVCPVKTKILSSWCIGSFKFLLKDPIPVVLLTNFIYDLKQTSEI